MIASLIEACVLGLVGGAIPGPILMGTFTEILNVGFLRGMKVILYALAAETIGALMVFFVFYATGINQMAVQIISVCGALVLVYLGFQVWNIREIRTDSKTVVSFPKIIVLTAFNSGYWIFWITIGVPKAMFLDASIHGGKFIFLTVFELAWFVMTLGLAYIFYQFRPLLQKKNLIGTTFKVFAIVLFVLGAKTLLSVAGPLEHASARNNSAPEATSTTATIAVDPVLLASLQTDMQGVTPHFIRGRDFDDASLTPQEQSIQNDVVALLVGKEPDTREYYSRLWLQAIGVRYILVSQPSAGSAYDVVIDSHTGESSFIENGASYVARYIPLEHPQSAQSRRIALYIGYKDVYTYTLDEPSFVLVRGSKLSGNDTYHSGLSDAFMSPEETHTDKMITVSVFDASQIVHNPRAEKNQMQTMNKKVRDVTLSF